MKNKLVTLALVFLVTAFTAEAQRGVRLGYIDMEYILQNVPDYQESIVQLEARVQRWKQDIDKQKQEIDQMKLDLSNERVLLTREMIEEREEEIQIKEDELFTYQQDRFGPNGDLINQKKQLVQPIQDQIFNIVQEIANNRNYDFIFDKSADVVMLYAAERNDISDQVVRSINRANKREQATSRDEERDIQKRESLSDEQDQVMTEREQLIEQRRAEREAIMEERRRVRDSIANARRAEAEARRNQKPNDGNASSQSDENETAEENETVEERNTSQTQTEIPGREEVIAQRQRERDSIQNARRAEMEARRQQIQEERQQRQDSIARARNNASENPSDEESESTED